MLPLVQMRRLSGFGRSRFCDGYVFQPRTAEDLAAIFELARQADRQVVLRGSGRSYGDAAMGAECIVVDIRGMDRILSWDPGEGVIEVEAGATLQMIWKHCLPDGWWLPVVSGTMFPTIAGTLAANIHGKNNFKEGCLGEHVAGIDILVPSQTPNCKLQTLTREDPLFFAIMGSFGLLAPIVNVKLQMKRILSGDLAVRAKSCRNWDEQFLAFESLAERADYMVSWVDCFARGNALGRGLFHSAVHSTAGDPGSLKVEHQGLPAKILGIVPRNKVWRLLKFLNNRAAMRFVNSAKHLTGKREHGKEHMQSLAKFSFLLDYVPDWELAYRPGGFIQYQSFIPKEHARRVFAEQIEMQQAEKLESFLGVMKRHRPDRFLLTHSLDGYSLALDFKVEESNRKRLWALCHRMNDLVVSAGGRFYFAKDSTLRPQDARAYLGEEAIAEFRRFKAELDRDNLLTSEVARRLELV